MVAGRFPGAVAESVEIVDAHSGTTGRARLRATWRSGSDAPGALFAKLAPSDPIQRAMVAATDMGRREARFYAELAEDVPVRVPAPIWAGWGEEPSSYFMLMEDLAELGCSFPSSLYDDGGVHAGAMMDTLGELHGRYAETPRFSGDLAWIEPPMRGEIGPLLVREAQKQFGGEMPQAFQSLAELYVEHTGALSDLLDQGSQTLLHGDSHTGNTFFEGDRVGLLDWACTCRAPGIRDVSYFLCSSIPTERRRSDERALLERYLAALAGAGAAAPAFEAAWLQHRRFAVCAWIAATATAAAGSRMQALDVGMRAMQRATAAIVDLETPSLLRNELGLGG
jgi:aminoglycoside phosphotransferase (APT) family kinase protein